MGYVAVRGGARAIEESLKLLEYERVSASSAWGTDDIEGTFPELVDQVMGEASLYAPRLAALALKQAQGSPDEAVFLLRAFRSTLERPYVSRPVDTGEMHVTRRVSAAFKDVPGGQLLGATRDYSHRLLAFDLETEGIGELAEKRAELARHFADAADAPAPATTLPRVLDYLRAQGLVAHVPADDAQPVDATMVPLTFPAPRSVRLQTLARGMTQEVESVFMDEGGSGEDSLSLAVGYGCVIGRAETKAIAMSVLDRCLELGDKRFPTEDEEFVLYHVDGVEATGFISHLKLPHYVTFQSKLSSVRGTRGGTPDDDRSADQAAAAALEAKEATDAATL